MTVRPLVATDAAAVAALHVACLQGLLADLGRPVVTAFYRAAVRLDETVGVVLGDPVVGFACGTLANHRYYRRVLRADPLGVGVGLAARLAVRPRLLARFAGGAEAPAGAELLFLALAPQVRGQGHGRRLLEAFETALLARGAAAYELSVEADNERAIAVYERRGLVRCGAFAEFGLARYRYRKELSGGGPA